MTFSESKDPLTGKPIKVFLYYFLLHTTGLLSITSASIIDGIFLGKFVGATALASVSLTSPLIAFIYGLGFMIGIGCSITCSKLIGEKKFNQASDIMTKSIILVIILSIFLIIINISFLEKIVYFLGADSEEIINQVKDYLIIMLPSMGVILLTYVIYYSVRADNNPLAGSLALTSIAIINIFLNWLFLAKFNWGVKGTALATGVAHFLGLVIILIYYFNFSKERKLSFKIISLKVNSFINSCFNGSSEFISELSIGITTLILNRAIVYYIGIEGVSSFAIVNYSLLVGLMIIYSACDSLGPLISQNMGNKNLNRMNTYLKYSYASVIIIGLINIIFYFTAKNLLINLFLDENESNFLELANLIKLIMSIIWICFLFNGFNMITGAYLTSVHKPVPSMIIALTRSLIFPVILINLLVNYFGKIGIFWSLPLAELFCFIISLAFLIKYLPKRLI